MPFTVAVAFQTICMASGGRINSAFPENFGAPVTALIREFPSLDDWRLVGEWFKAGYEGYRDDLDVRALVKGGNLAIWIGKSREWHASGRPAPKPSGRGQLRVAHPKRPDGFDDIAAIMGR